MLTGWKTDWTGIPNTDKRAKPSKYKFVKNAKVLVVKRASIRSAIISNGVFYLNNIDNPFSHYKEKTRASVECMWFGRKPKVTWMNLTVYDGEWEIKNKYTGDVIVNISR